jgi:hypothetical protein
MIEIMPQDSRRIRLPDFFILGAAKSGTTSLHLYLQKHPDIFMPSPKEPWFFSSGFLKGAPGRGYLDYHRDGMIRDLPSYAALFNDARQRQLCGDASPSYLYTHHTTIPNILSVYAPDSAWQRLRFIAILRNPIERAWSQYWTFRMNLREPLSFTDAIEPQTIASRIKSTKNPLYDYIGAGMYTDQIKAYRDAFGSSKVLLLLFDDLKKDPHAVCKAIFSHIGVSPDFRPGNIGKTYNITGEPRFKFLVKLVHSQHVAKKMITRLVSKRAKQHLRLFLAKKIAVRQQLMPDTRLKLLELYREEIANLEHYLQRDLAHWRATEPPYAD